MHLRNLSLRARLVSLMVGTSLVVAALGGLALWTNASVSNSLGDMQERSVQPLARLDVVGRVLERQRSTVLATIAATNDLMIEALEKQAANDSATFSREMAALRAKAMDPDERTLVGDLAARIEASQSGGLSGVLGFLRKGQFVEADVAAQQQYRPQVDAASAALDRVIDGHLKRSRGNYEASQDLVRLFGTATLAATLLAVCGGVALALAIAGGLRRTLGASESDLALGARHVAEGRLDHRIVTDGRDTTSVAASLNAMSSAFAALVEDVARSAREVASAAARVSVTGERLATQTSGQAASLEETSASMQQIAVTVHRNSEGAVQARDIAQRASAVATKGGEQMASAVTAMAEVSARSKHIGEIIALIDGIAFQTNILALNAAVEAARAGENGRGFAVVAAEVRALSQRSGAAAKEIRDLLAQSASRSEDGRRLVEEAGATMAEIVSATAEVTRVVSDIAGASREQSIGIAQVNAAVEQLELATQRNAALAEDAVRESREMTRQAESLVGGIARFSTTDGDASGRGEKEAEPAVPPTPSARLELGFRAVAAAAD